MKYVWFVYKQNWDEYGERVDSVWETEEAAIARASGIVPMTETIADRPYFKPHVLNRARRLELAAEVFHGAAWNVRPVPLDTPGGGEI